MFTGDHREHPGKYYHGLDLMKQAESLRPRLGGRVHSVRTGGKFRVFLKKKP